MKAGTSRQKHEEKAMQVEGEATEKGDSYPESLSFSVCPDVT
jgi:hypothetical protein